MNYVLVIMFCFDVCTYRPRPVIQFEVKDKNACMVAGYSYAQSDVTSSGPLIMCTDKTTGETVRLDSLVRK